MGNFVGVIFSFIVLSIIGSLFLLAYIINLKFSIEYKAINKTQIELAKNYLKSLINIFKNTF